MKRCLILMLLLGLLLTGCRKQTQPEQLPTAETIDTQANTEPAAQTPEQTLTLGMIDFDSEKSVLRSMIQSYNFSGAPFRIEILNYADGAESRADAVTRMTTELLAGNDEGERADEVSHQKVFGKVGLRHLAHRQKSRVSLFAVICVERAPDDVAGLGGVHGVQSFFAAHFCAGDEVRVETQSRLQKVGRCDLCVGLGVAGDCRVDGLGIRRKLELSGLFDDVDTSLAERGLHVVREQVVQKGRLTGTRSTDDCAGDVVLDAEFHEVELLFHGGRRLDESCLVIRAFVCLRMEMTAPLSSRMIGGIMAETRMPFSM